MNTVIDTVGERTKLEGELAVALANVEQAKNDFAIAERRRLPSNFRYEIGDLELSVDVIRGRLVRNDKIEAYQHRVAASDDDARTALNSMTGTKDQLLVVEGRMANIKKRAADMVERDQNAMGEVVDIETSAIRVYASAVSACDAKAEKAAHSKVLEAQAAVAVVQTQVAKNEAITAAFQVESLALDKQADDLKQAIAQDRNRMLLAIKVGLEAQWDVAAADLAALAAKLVAAGSYSGNGCYSMEELKIPLFSPVGSTSIDIDDVREIANKLNESQLLPV